MKRLWLGLLALLFTTSLAIGFDPVAKYYSTVPTFNSGDATPLLTDANGRTVTVLGPYASTQTPLIAGSGNVANAAAAATLTGTATTTVYLTGLEMTGGGATAGALVTCTITGLLGGTRSFIFGFPTGAAVAALPVIAEFSPPLPASAVNTAIVASCPAAGAGNTNAAMIAHGFYQ